MFVDSSALVAMIASEGDGEAFAERLKMSRRPVTSPIVIFETALALARIFRASTDEMTLNVIEFLEQSGIDVIEVRADAHLIALKAHQQFGKGTGHGAQLNMGDCFSYAVAKSAGIPLLYKGIDFAQTDLR